MEIKFHSNSGGFFENGEPGVRAFVYTDYSIEPHDHDFYEMNIVLRGSGTHIIEGSSISVKTGDVFMIPPFTVHAYYDTKDLDVYHVLFDKSFISSKYTESIDVPGYLQLVEIEPFLRQNSMGAMFLHLTQGQLQQIKDELTFIADNGPFDFKEFVPMRKHAALKMLYYLSYLLNKQINSAENKAEMKYEYAILHALEYIHSNFSEKISIDTLLKQTFLSKSTFLRSFYDICSQTPIEYLNKYRCRKALELIENTMLTKTEIAHRCGFYDLSHMERFLKKFYYKNY